MLMDNAELTFIRLAQTKTTRRYSIHISKIKITFLVDEMFLENVCIILLV